MFYALRLETRHSKGAAHSKHMATGLATPVVVAQLGQSAHSLNAGITAAYVGARNEDSWTKRVRSVRMLDSTRPVWHQ
ncbi:hypothetical protein O988_08785 [Pseudogymnoascus sp. VKM F-3808]|nr:hypothetical protein O988_08785 [Pseudogymnoascus sp. VKM F-3808]